MNKRVLLPCLLLTGALMTTGAAAAESFTGAPAITHVGANGSVTYYDTNGKPVTTKPDAVLGQDGVISGGMPGAGGIDLSGLPTGPSLSIDEIEDMVREDNLQVRMMNASLDMMEDMDPEDQIDAMNSQYQGLQQMISGMEGMLKFTDPITDPSTYALLQSNIAMLNSQAMQMKAQISSIENEYETQLDQMETQYEIAEDQLVFAAESTYIGLTAMESGYADLLRSRATLTNTVEEMRLRYKLGQISALQLQEVENGMVNLETKQKSLETNILNVRGDLNLLLGRDAGKEFSLAALPRVTDAQIAAIDYDSDLKTVKKKSSDIRAAADAKRDASGKYAKKAAELKYEQTVNTVSQNFLKLCRAVSDQRALVTAAQSDYALAQRQHQVAQTKFKNGQISPNAMKAADAELATAANAVTNAQNDLYTAYMKYDWAMRGIVSAN